MTRPTWLWVSAVAVVLAGYVLISVASGLPRFPTRDECILAPVEGKPVDIVFGRFDDPVTARELGDRVLAVGFLGTETIADGCGRWKVVLEDVPSVEIGREIQEEAATVDLEPTLERGSGDE